MPRNLSFDLHALTARLDREADRILRAEYGLSYQRFLVLWTVDELGRPSQHEVAESLGVTDPSSGRMTAILVVAGLLDSRPDPAGGRRRCLSLTPEGRRLVEDGRALLECSFAALVARSGVAYASYAGDTARLIDALDEVRKAG